MIVIYIILLALREKQGNTPCIAFTDSVRAIHVHINAYHCISQKIIIITYSFVNHVRSLYPTTAPHDSLLKLCGDLAV